jgi:hypothetical protein
MNLVDSVTLTNMASTTAGTVISRAKTEVSSEETYDT